MTEKILLLYSAMRDKRTPWYAKALVALVLAYIISPIDIIPDFIPVVGLLDEIILVPIALFFIYKLIPESVKQDESLNQIDVASKKRLMITGILLVILIWVILLILVLSFNLFDPVIAFFA
jgi:uncharacterized membrane protein YkvA (DUF1232 family)